MKVWENTVAVWIHIVEDELDGNGLDGELEEEDYNELDVEDDVEDDVRELEKMKLQPIHLKKWGIYNPTATQTILIRTTRKNDEGAISDRGFKILHSSCILIEK